MSRLAAPKITREEIAAALSSALKADGLGRTPGSLFGKPWPTPRVLYDEERENIVASLIHVVEDLLLRSLRRRRKGGPAREERG